MLKKKKKKKKIGRKPSGFFQISAQGGWDVAVRRILAQDTQSPVFDPWSSALYKTKDGGTCLLPALRRYKQENQKF